MLWLFGPDHEVTEVGAMNVFAFLEDKSTGKRELVTPPLDKGIIYIYKPPIYLRYDECNKVEFERTGGQVWTLTIFLSIYFFIFFFKN